MQRELLGRQGHAKLMLQARAGARHRGHFTSEESVGVATRGLGGVQRQVGALQQRLRQLVYQCA